MELIKKLRELTGAGMVDCKNALTEANNDLDKAVEILRNKGIAKAAKRSGRETNEGIIMVDVNANQNVGYILELNSETDFVARNENFLALANKIMVLVKEHEPENLDNLLDIKIDDFTVRETLANLSGTTGENLVLSRFELLQSATVAAYSHAGGRIGVLVGLDKPNQSELASEVAMQVAASNPKYLNSTDVDKAEMLNEEKIYREQLLKEGKPENILDKIVAGKMGKYYSEVCLVEQEYIKDDKKKVKDILGDVQVTKFIRYSL